MIKHSFVVVIVAGIVAVPLAGAIGQGQEPRSLLPTKPLELHAPSATEPVVSPSNPDTLTKSPPGGETGSAGQTGKQGIDMNTLGAVTTESLGTLDAETGGLPVDMWSGTPRETIDRLVDLLPVQTMSRTLGDLRRKLLLSTAIVPESSTPNPETLLLKRVRTLFWAGDHAAAQDLLSAAPAPNNEEALARLGADIGFVTNNLAAACDTSAIWVESSKDHYWQKVIVFCEAMNGAWERVDFGMRLLIELEENDETFFSLMRAIGGEASAAAALEPDSLRPIDLAMLRGAKAGLPDPGDKLPAPWLINAYLADPAVTLETRMRLAEMAERTGLTKQNAIVTAYEAMEVSADLLESVESVAEADPGPRGRALLYRAALAQQSAIGRAQAISQALAVASGRRDLAGTARLYAPMVHELPVGSELGWFAAEAGLLLVSEGDFKGAQPWINLAEREAQVDPEANQAWNRVWPLIRVLTGEPQVEGGVEVLQNWWAQARIADPDSATGKATVLLGLLSALGESVPSTVWRGLVSDPPGERPPHPGLAISRALAGAAEEGRIGEAAALILILVGSIPLEQVAPTAMVEAVKALIALGLEDDARQLAFDFALAAGL